MTSTVVFSTDRHKPTTEQKQRQERRPAGISLGSNPHYFQVMTWLLKLRFMTAQQVGRILDPPRKRSAVYDLLKRMDDAGLTARFAVPLKKHWGRTRAYGATRDIHCLDRAGAEFLAERYQVARSEIDWQPRDNQRHSFLEHKLSTNDALITMHRGARRLGWRFEIMQSERDIHKRGGHDWVRDPKTKRRKPVKADTVCHLRLATGKSAWLSLELDMGTEGEKKIKQKFRLHREHYESGKYQERHSTTSSRVVFVVADVRDPLLTQPMDQREWRRRVRERVLTLKRWAEEEGMRKFFWFSPVFALTEWRVWEHPLWMRPGADQLVPFIH